MYNYKRSRFNAFFAVVLILAAVVEIGTGNVEQVDETSASFDDMTTSSPSPTSKADSSRKMSSSSGGSSSSEGAGVDPSMIAELTQRLAFLEQQDRKRQEEEATARERQIREQGMSHSSGGMMMMGGGGGGLLSSDASEALDDGEQSLLEVFGDVAKQWLVKNLAPTTDPQCTWSWRFGRCEPRCQCQFAPKLGDYWPGRACRLVTSSSSTSTGSNSIFSDRDGANGSSDNEETEVCDPNAPERSTIDKLRRATVALAESVRNGLRRVPSTVGRASAVSLGTAVRAVVSAAKTLERHAPPTDRECSFNWEPATSGGHSNDAGASSGGGRLNFCEPSNRCQFRYTFGDFHPGRSCRLIPANHPVTDRDEEREAAQSEGSGVEDGPQDSSSPE